MIGTSNSLSARGYAQLDGGSPAFALGVLAGSYHPPLRLQTRPPMRINNSRYRLSNWVLNYYTGLESGVKSWYEPFQGNGFRCIRMARRPFFIFEYHFSACLTFSRSNVDDSQTSIRLQEAPQGFNKASGCFASLQ